MKISTTATALLLTLSLTGLSAQAHGQRWENNTNWSMNGQSGQQRTNQYDAPQVNRNSQP